MHFVDHVDLEPPFGRRIHRSLKELRHILNRAVRGRIHFDVVDKTPFINCAASFAHAAGVRRHAALAVRALTVERLGEDAGNGGLPNAARAGKQIRVMQPPFGERTRERRHHVVLADDGFEIMGTPLAGEYLVAAHLAKTLRALKNSDGAKTGPPIYGALF